MLGRVMGQALSDFGLALKTMRHLELLYGFDVGVLSKGTAAAEALISTLCCNFGKFLKTKLVTSITMSHECRK